MIYLGAHLSSSKGFYKMGRDALAIGANTFQCFVRNPRGAKAKQLDPDDLEKLRVLLAEQGFGPIVAHAPYIMNPCSKDESIPALAERMLGVGEENIHEFFGAVEHPVFFNTCKNHRFHVPDYARVLIRDVRTLEPLPMGQAGLVNLITPLISATPVTSVMTDDLGVLEPGEACGCGITTPTLTILGRVGLRDITTCAAGAAELLERGEMT